MMALPSNIWTGVPYLVSLVKFTNMSPTYLLLINILNKTYPRTDLCSTPLLTGLQLQ